MEIQWIKYSFLKIGAGRSGHPYRKNKNFNPHLAPYISINSKWVIDLKLNPKFTDFLEEHIEKNLCDFR